MTALTDRDIRLASIRQQMDQAMAERLAAEARYRLLTEELIEVGAEVRAEMERETEGAR